MRYVALIRPTDIHPPTRNFIGLPIELSPDGTPPAPMPWPRVLVIRQVGRPFFLDRYTEDGRPAGDTWHQDLEEAREQAVDEYEGALAEWRLVPDDVPDERLIEFALKSPDAR